MPCLDDSSMCCFMSFHVSPPRLLSLMVWLDFCWFGLPVFLIFFIPSLSFMHPQLPQLWNCSLPLKSLLCNLRWRSCQPVALQIRDAACQPKKDTEQHCKGPVWRCVLVVLSGERHENRWKQFHSWPPPPQVQPCYGKLLGQETVCPMDPSWDRKRLL